MPEYCFRIEKNTGRVAYWGPDNAKQSLNTDAYEKVYLPLSARPNEQSKWDFQTNTFVPDQTLVNAKKIRNNRKKANKHIEETKSIIERHKIEKELAKSTTLTEEQYVENLRYLEGLYKAKLGNDPDFEIPQKSELSRNNVKVKNITFGTKKEEV